LQGTFYFRFAMTYQELLVQNMDQKNKIASLENQLQELYKLISGFKSERFITEALSSTLKTELFRIIKND
jgi:hypothetical protein